MNNVKETSTTKFIIKDEAPHQSYTHDLTIRDVVKRISELQQVCLNLAKKSYNAIEDKNGNLRYYNPIKDSTQTLSYINTGRGHFNWIFIKDFNDYTIETLDNGYIRFTHKEHPTLSHDKYHFYLHQNNIRQPFSVYLKELRKDIYKDKKRSRRLHYLYYGDNEIQQLEDRLRLLKKIREETKVNRVQSKC